MTQPNPDTVATAIAALYRYRDDYFERQPEYKDATAAIADLETLQQAASEDVGEWTPVEDGMYGVNEELAVNGDILAIFVDQEYGDTSEKLPPDIRLCRMVAAPQPAAMEMPTLSDISIQRIQIILSKYDYKDAQEHEIMMDIWEELNVMRQRTRTAS